MDRFRDQVVLITGAGRGIGRALAQAFAAEGAVVAANDLTPINLDETVSGILSCGGRVRDYVFDVAKKMSVQGLIEAVHDDFGRIDILINNAGVRPRGSILEMDEWDWRRTLDVNLNGPFFTIQSAGRVMREQGGGVIVNLGAAGRQAGEGVGQAAFAASKAGLVALTREAARELAPYHIRVNAVCPGAVDTAWEGEFPAAAQTGRLGTPEDVSGLVLFLCSPAAAHLNGQAIEIDGGPRPD